jgi:hypothetical protein
VSKTREEWSLWNAAERTVWFFRNLPQEGRTRVIQEEAQICLYRVYCLVRGRPRYRRAQCPLSADSKTIAKAFPAISFSLFGKRIFVVRPIRLEEDTDAI